MITTIGGGMITTYWLGHDHHCWLGMITNIRDV
jgi:hypothetical protein